MNDTPPPVLFHMLRVANHVSINAKVNWYPWSNHPDKVAVGWEAIPHEGGPSIFCYLIPDLMAMTPKMNVYLGTAGDPALDPIVTSIEVT